MSAGLLNLTIEAGADLPTITATMTDENDAPVDLTGYTFSAKMKDTPEGNAVGELTVTLLDQTTDTGKFEISMTAEETAALPLDVEALRATSKKLTTYIYDLKMTSPGGIVDRVFEGTVSVSPGVS